MKFKNLKEAKDALRAKYDEMKSEEDAEKFKSLNAEFEDIKSEIARMEALDAAEKAFAAEKAVEAKSEEKKAEGYEAAVKSFEAGADIILMPEDLPGAFDAVLKRVQSGKITEKRLNDTVQRILKLKFQKGIMTLEDTAQKKEAE